MVPVLSENVRSEYETLLAELEAFNPRMLEKPRAVVISKMDLVAPDVRTSRLDDAVRAIGDDVSVFAISSVAHLGLDELRTALWQEVQDARSFDGS